MVYKGLSEDDVFEYVLESERETEGPKTIWGLRPQGVASGNQSLARIVKAHGRRNIDESASEQTKANRREFLKMLAYVKNFVFSGETEITALIDDPKGIDRIFGQIDISTFLELANASKDIYTLRQGEKNGSGSSYGLPSGEKIPGGNDTTVEHARSSEVDPGSLVQ